MSLNRNFPLYFIPNANSVTISGVVNAYGNIYHDTPVDRIKTWPKYYLNYVFPNLSLNTTKSGITLSPIETTRPYITYPLGFFYTTEGLMTLGALDLSAEITVELLRQIHTYGDYVYSASLIGIDIFNAITGSFIYRKLVPDCTIVTIWGNSDTLFFGGTGLFYVKYNDLHSDYEGSILKTLSTTTSNYVRYIHGLNNSLLISTSSGIEYINWENNPTILSVTSIENPGKCFLTGDTAYYINSVTTSGVTQFNLNTKRNLLTNWYIPTYTYTTGSGMFDENITMNDIYITEKTAWNGGNTIFCATSSGVYVIDEDTLEYVRYFKR